MDYVLKLPNELLLLISQSCDHMHDLGALSLTCRRFHSIFDKLLYERAVTGHHYLLTWACETGNIGLVAKLLDAGADPNRPFGTTRRQARYRIFGAYRNAYVEDFYGLSPDVNFLDPFVVLDFVYGHRSHVSERLGEAGELPSPISDESAGLPASGAGENSEDSLGDSNDDLHDSSMDEVGSLEADFSDYNTTTDDDDPSLSENELLSGTPTRFECTLPQLGIAAAGLCVMEKKETRQVSQMHYLLIGHLCIQLCAVVTHMLPICSSHTVVRCIWMRAQIIMGMAQPQFTTQRPSMAAFPRYNRPTTNTLGLISTKGTVKATRPCNLLIEEART
ncbi:hypothetical protein JX266_007609 [Neoarthrinium moseri]|nr:hypothetical protein JX266_007609 [Neoarthrinium moseri]